MLENKSNNLRLLLVSLFFGLLFVALLVNLYTIQVKHGKFYIARAESQLDNNLIAPRGTIYFTDREDRFIPVALDKKYSEIYAVPIEIPDAEEMAARLSPLVGESISSLTFRLSKPKDQYESLINKATPEEVLAFADLNLFNKQGIYHREIPHRFYPFADRAAHLIGYTDATGGTYGIEKYFNTRLAGIPGQVIGDQVTPPVPGRDVYLTIDNHIQSQAEEILTDMVESFSSPGGSIIVQEPKTGRILAMASYPSFDPNNYSDYSISSFLNPTVENIYEPGSIFKVLTMAIGLDTDSFTPDTTYYDSGSVTLNGSTIRNWDLQSHGTQTMTGVIEHSLNTGTVFAEKLIGHTTFLDYLYDFGLDTPTGISLPGEVGGSLNSLERNAQDINFATASFGQGIALSSLKLIQAISAIANDGVMMKPILETNAQPQVARKLFSKDAADKVTSMMISAVDKAILAAIPGYTVAGKTGTAQIPDFKNGGYSDKVINTYVGFAPTTNPQVTVLVKLNDPAGAPLAGHTVVPAFKELTQFIINYYQIPPDRLD